ncbi:MAG: adenylate/guanylate cyclase domain-containing protein [Actinobacteria bacterium]|nr:MAG: adenylate/guanylate cyclase domain-containing protein [Actinomycetota bacterium]
MRTLPTGTVTFLFTDIEGSTRLLHELGSEYADVLAEHRRLLREAFAQHGGVEVDTQGDAFFVAFSRASGALAAARDATDALAEPVRVRIGIHTGEPVVTDEGYVGIDVHRAARIAAVGHGGQILVSQSTRELCGPEGLRDLGLHRLKDLTAPERIFQLGDRDFPPVKSLNTTNLPVAANPLVGRATELAELSEMLVDGERLVTLTGPGGSGKTRLSLQVAAEVLDDFPGGVFFVPLAPLESPELVRPAIARTVGVPDIEEIADRRALLLLDNFEHLLDAAPEVTAVLRAGHAVKVLATSRAPLRIQGECEYAVDPLPERDGVELLIQRARSIRRDFVPNPERAANVCRRLDGLPLALELAAGQLRFLDADTLVERLEQRLPLLTGGARDAPERQRTLRATIEWSFDLLPESLQDVFARLAVFAGTLSLEAAEVVAEAKPEEVRALVEASLVKALAGTRFLMLETIREFALERLAELQDVEALRRRHAMYYRALALTASLDTDVPDEQQPEIVFPEVPNLRAALAWAFEHDEIEFGLALLVALEQFWVSGYTDEGMGWYRAFLERADDAPPLLRAPALRSFGSSAHFSGDFALAERLWEESLSIYESEQNEHGIAVLLHRLSISALEKGDPELARERAERSLELHRRADNDKGACQPLSVLGALAMRSGDVDAGVALLEESARLGKQAGWRWWHAGTQSALADIALAQGRAGHAKNLLRESIHLACQIRDRVGLSWYLSQFAVACAMEGETREAGRIWGAVESARAFIPGGPWPRDFPALEQRVRALADDDFENGRAEGQALAPEDVADAVR